MNFDKCRAITIDGRRRFREDGARVYNRAVERILLDLCRFQTGNLVFDLLRQSGRWVNIVPESGDPSRPNAFARTARWNAQTIADRNRPGVQPLICDDRELQTTSDILAALGTGRIGQPWPDVPLGTGRGVELCEVEFTPRLYDSSGDLKRDASRILLHELLHTWRMLAGQVHCVLVNHYTNLEEFYAILVENMYASERGWPMRSQHGVAPRGDYLFESLCRRATGPMRDPNVCHHEGAPLPAGGATTFAQEFSRRFAREHQANLLDLKHNDLTLFHRLSNVQGVPFNPCKELIYVLREAGEGGGRSRRNLRTG